MADKLWLIGGTGSFIWMIYALSIRTEPGHGIMRLIERVCAGAAICWLCHALLQPFGLKAAQSPLAALSAGYLGLPGAALASVLAYWP